MEEVDARVTLGVSIEASVADIEAAYRERVREVRKRFEKAIDRRTRTQLEREFAALEDARDCLLSEPVEQIFADDHSAPPSPHQVEPIPISDELKPGKVFAGRFELQRELSNDSAGTVWLANDYSLQHQVVLSFLPDVLTGHRGALEDLQKEVRARIELRHPNLARTYALVEDEGRVAVATEHVEGQNLSQLRSSKQNQVFEAKDLGTWVKELCGALEHLHKEARLIHGAIEPSCLIVKPGGSLQLADLGLGRLIRDSLIRLIGGSKTNETLAHSSPQQAKGEKLTVADDVYSLGAALYELLTGKPPFYQGNIRAQIEEMSAPSMTERRIQLGIIGELIPKNWEETIAACLSKQASQRPKSLVEVIRRLEKVDAQPSGSPIVQHRPAAPGVKSTPSPVEPASIADKRESTPVEHAAAPGKPESIPIQQVSVPSKPQSTPAKPISAAAKVSPDTVVPDSVSAKRPSTPVPPISPPAKPPHGPVQPVPPSVGRVPPPAYTSPSPPRAPQTPVGSVPTPPRGSQEPVIPVPAPGKRSRAPLISLLSRRPVWIVGGIILLLILASLAIYFWSHSGSPPSANPSAQPSASGSIAQATASPLITTSPTVTVSPQVTASPQVTTSPQVTASPIVTPSSEASTTASPTESATANDANASPTPLTQPEIDATKQEVIKRINAAPGYNAEEKAILIQKMERARKMERLTVVRFDSGQTGLNRSALDRLVKTFDGAEMRDKLSDQTILLVVAGYADTGGRAEVNLGISQQRAESVARILRRRIKLTNPMQTIGMGGTELLSNERPDQNRAVEVWAVTVF